MQNQTKYLLILISQISSKQSKLLAEQSFDAWGRMRDPETWKNLSPDAVRLLSFVEVNGRGYTAHEMLPTFALINMNGRLYDPVLGRMLSPDNYIQAPDYTQNFNRYSYVLNNPLKYTDPDGEFINLIIGAIVGAYMGYIAGDMAGATGWKLAGYIGVGALAGALTSGMAAGVGSVLGGGSFGAGFVGSATAAAATAPTGFIAGATIGASSGFAGGFVTGVGTGLLENKTFGQSLGQGALYGGIGAVSGGLIGGVSGGISAVRDKDPVTGLGRDFWTGERWTVTKYELPPTWSAPDGNLPIREQASPYGGCSYKSAESIADYKMHSFGELNQTDAADFREIMQPNFDTRRNLNDVYTIGGQMRNGNPSAITYKNGDVYHTVAINKIKLYSRPRLFKPGAYKIKTFISVMNPLHNSYQRLPLTIFNNESSIIRTVYGYNPFGYFIP